MTRLPLSGAQIDRLGVRLRDSPDPDVDPEDLTLLQDLLLAHDQVLRVVAERLRGIGLEPTTRLKTSGTIIDKLRRERPLTLRSIRDLAGARIVQPMTLDEQDEVRDRILGVWPEAKVIDRRRDPNHGYRAIHVIPRVDGCWVEIQIRTVYQDTWAQLMERLGDMWGRQIRYGGEPDDPGSAVSPESTRQEMLDAWLSASAVIAQLEDLENRQVRQQATGASEDLVGVPNEIERSFAAWRDALRELRSSLGLPK